MPRSKGAGVGRLGPVPGVAPEGAVDPLGVGDPRIPRLADQLGGRKAADGVDHARAHDGQVSVIHGHPHCGWAGKADDPGASHEGKRPGPAPQRRAPIAHL